MLPPELPVLNGRQGFADAQADMTGGTTLVGICDVSWYGSTVDDERGSFGLVEPTGNFSGLVGNTLQLRVGFRSVTVYIIGSYSGLTTDIAVTRRSFLAVAVPAQDPVQAIVSVVG
jgi:hypothetical protein